MTLSEADYWRAKYEGSQSAHHRLWCDFEGLKLERDSLAQRLRKLRIEMLVARLTVAIDTCHSGHCRKPIERIRRLRARLERLRSAE